MKKSKVATIILWVVNSLVALALVGVGGFLISTGSCAKNTEEPEPKILVSEELEAFLGEPLNIVPEYVDAKGKPVDNVSFSYAYESHKQYISIDKAGVVTVLKPYDKEIPITIKALNVEGDVSVTVKLRIISELDGVDGIQQVVGGDTQTITQTSLTTLKIGESYTFEVTTKPLSTDIDKYFSFTSVSEKGVSKNVFEYSVSENRVTMTAVGLGSGTLNFNLKNENRGLNYSVSYPFNVSFQDENFNRAVLENGEGLLSKAELNSVQTLVFDGDVSEVTEAKWDYLPSLEKVVFERSGEALEEGVTPVVDVRFLNKVGTDVVFRVNGLETYEQYAESVAWKDRLENIYPYVDDDYTQAVVVYHNEENYKLSGSVWQGNSVVALDSETQFDYATSSGLKVAADGITNNYLVRTPSCDGYTFMGWKDKDATTFSDEDLFYVTEGIHVYATWQAKRFEVTLDGLYTDGTKNAQVSVEYDTGLSVLPDGRKPGWTFEGWYISNDYNENEKITEGVIYRVNGNKRIYAKYSAELELTYTATVNEERTDTIPIVYGKEITSLPNQLTSDNWTFGGWYVDETYEDEITSQIPYVREGETEYGFSHKLYSKFTRSMQFDVLSPMSDTQIDNLTLYAGLTIDEALALEDHGRTWATIRAIAKNGWTFGGWTSQTYHRGEKSGFDTVELNDELFVDGTSISSANYNVLYAVYKQKDVVVYDPNGASSYEKDIVYGCISKKPSSEEEMEKISVDGYTFVGWYTVDGQIATDGEMIVSPKTYVAKYEAIQYAVKFYAKDDALLTDASYLHVVYSDVGYSPADNVMNNDEETFVGRTLDLTNVQVPEWAGYTGYWTYNGKKIEENTFTVPENVFEEIKLKAEYEANVYKVSFDTHGVGEELESKTVTFGKVYGRLPDPEVPKGYTFIGWFTSKTYEVWIKENNKYEVVGDSTLYAKYEMDMYLDDVKQESSPAVYNNPYTFKVLSNEDAWGFGGWYYLDGGIEQYIDHNVSNFKSSVNKYYSHWTRTIRLNLGDNNFRLTPNLLIVERDKSLNAIGGLPKNEDFIKSGYAQNWDLEGWYYNFNGVEYKVDEDKLNSVEFSNNTEIRALYAKYTSTVTVKIQYVSIGSEDGLQDVVESYAVNLGDELFETLSEKYETALNADEKNGFYFTGWKVGENTYTVGNAELSFGGMDVVAVFAPISYTVEYNTNGAENQVASQKVDCDQVFALANAPLKTGYKFTGWKLNDGRVYEAGEEVENLTYTPNDVLTLTAQWEAITYNVKFNTDGGSEVETMTPKYGETFTFPENPTKHGYSFVGWSMDGKTVYQGELINLCVKEGDSVEFKALWSSVKYVAVYFDYEGGNEIGRTEEIEYGQEFVLPNAREREGYTFVAWRAPDGNEYEAGSTVSNLTGVAGEIAVTAVWDAIKYQIIYHDEDGKPVGVDSYYYTVESESYPQPPVPQKEGYVGYWDFSTLTKPGLSQNIVTAKYTLISYTVYYYAGDTLIKKLSYTVEANDSMNDEQAPTAEEVASKYSNKGYQFVGWQKDGWTDWLDWTIVDKYCYAEFSPVVYTLNFVDKNNELVEAVQITLNDLTFATPEVPTIDGYFVEWDLTREGLFEAIESLENGQTTITIKSKEQVALVYNVSVKVDGESYVYPYTVESLEQGKLELYLPKGCENYFYAVYGAELEEFENGKMTLSVSSLGDIFAEAKSEEYEYAFLVVFEDIGEELSVVVGKGETVLMPNVPERDGYVFAGWSYGGNTFVDVEALTIEAEAGEKVEIVAIWTPIEYSVSFDTLGGELSETVETTVAYAQDIVLPNATRKGYTLVGWNVNGSTYPIGEAVSKLTKENGACVTLTAVWSAIGYNVVYLSNGGEEQLLNHTARYGEGFNLPAGLTMKGYLFAGWSVTIDGEEQVFASNARVKDFVSVDGGTAIVTATWTPITYTVIFDNVEGVADMTCEYNKDYSFPTEVDERKDSYVFYGWKYFKRYFQNGEWKEEEIYVSAEDAENTTFKNLADSQGATVVVYARWNYYAEEERTVYFDTKGLIANEETKAKIVSIGTEITLPNVQKDGYKFLGWALGGATYAGGETYTVGSETLTNDKTIWFVAQWDAIEYTITFEGVSYKTTYTVEPNGPEIQFPTEYEELKKVGYICQWELPETMLGNVHAPLRYQPISFTVSFDTNGGEGEFQPKTVYYKSNVWLGEPNKAGYVFGGWKNADGRTYVGNEIVQADFTVTDGDTVTLVAVWTEERVSYTATFVANGREIATLVFTAADFGKQLLAPTLPNKAHYTGAWEAYTLSDSDLVIEAVYTPIVYSIEYYYQIQDTDEVTLIHTAYYTVENPAPALAFNPQIEGYIFVGYGEFTQDGGNREVEAIYTPVKYTVEFDSDGGTEVGSLELNYDQAFTLTQTSEKKGHTFRGWKLEGTDGAITELNNLSSEDGASVKLVAIWEVNTYVLSYNVAGGNEEEEDVEVEYSTSVTLAPAPEKVGYTFAGWLIAGETYDAEEEITYGYDFSVEAVAQWKLIKYYVIFDKVPKANGGEQVWTVESGAVTEPSGGNGSWKKKEADNTYTEYVLEVNSFTFNEEWTNEDGETVGRWELVLYQQSGVSDGAPYVAFQNPVYDEANGEFQYKDTEKTELFLKVIAKKYYTAGDALIVPVVPTVKGYIGEWDFNVLDGNYFVCENGRITISAIPDGEAKYVTITAKYTPIEYTVNYLSVGEQYHSLTATYDVLFELPVEPTRTGYTFEGWSLNGVDKYEGALINLCENNGGVVEFNAIWTPIEYTVKFFEKTGDDTPFGEVTLTYDKGFEFLSITREGYEFLGWFDRVTKKKIATVDEIKAILESSDVVTVELIADWIPETHTAIFVDENGKIVGEAIYRIYAEGAVYFDVLDENNQIVQTNQIPYPEIPSTSLKEHYVTDWDKFVEFTKGGTTIGITYTPIDYKVEFVLEGEVVAISRYRIASENEPDSPSFTNPKYPDLNDSQYAHLAKEHYIIVWDEIVFDGGQKRVTGEYKAVTYTVTFYVAPESEEIFATATYTVENVNVPVPTLPSGYVAWDMPTLDGGDKKVYPLSETAENYVIKFVDVLGKEVTSLVWANGKAFTQKDCPAVPQRLGYSGAWNIPEEFATGVTKNATLSPVYEEIVYTVTFVKENGEAYATATYTVNNDNIVIPAVPEKEHYYGVWEIPELTVGDVSVSVRYSPIVYTLTFYRDYEHIGTTQEVLFSRAYTIENPTISIPNIPEKDGYDVATAIWQVEVEDADGKKPIALTSVMEYFGNYNVFVVYDKFEIEYDENGAQSTAPSHYGSCKDGFTTAKISRTGYILTGWTWNDKTYDADRYYTGEEVKELGFGVGENGKVTFVAVWTPITYKVVFNENGGVEIEDFVATYDKPFNLPTTTREGYTFKCWQVIKYFVFSGDTYAAGEEVINLKSTNDATITLKAQWDANTYTVTYNANGGDGGSTANSSHVYDESKALTANGFTRTGYTFGSWNTEADGTGTKYTACQSVENLTAMPNGTVTLYAQWIANKYTIKFVAYGASGTMADSLYTYDVWQSLPECGFFKTGYWVSSWNTKSDGTGTKYSTNQVVGNLTATPNGTVTLYAQWTANTFTIVYNANGGDGGSTANSSHICDTPKALTKNGFTRTGHTFDSWNTQPDGSGLKYTDGQSVNILTNVKEGVINLYAQWTANTYMVSFNYDGGGGTENSCESFRFIAYGGSYGTLPSASKGNSDYCDKGCCYTYYSFSYWKDENGNEVKNNSGMYVPRNHTLTAVWSSDRHTEDHGCFATGTLVTLADGTQKPIENIKQGDLVLSWNFMSGRFEAMPVSLYWNHGEDVYEIINLCFSNGEIIKVILEHGFFDYDLNKFVFISKDNYQEYIGHKFVSYGKDTYDFIVLEKVYITMEKTVSYSLRTACNDNVIVANMITLTLEDYEGFLTYFEVGENLKYDEEKMQADIEKYGLYTYEEWSEYVTYEEFVALNGQYYKILIGKGIITYENIFTLIEGMRNIK